MLRKFAAVVLLAALAPTDAAHAQQAAVLAQMYGKGVHAFFSHDYTQAHRLFTGAIDSGTRDPRVYYFRAMTYFKLGRPDEAQADMVHGAVLEAEDVGERYDVNRALQRVQGRARQQLERHRLTARLKRLERQKQLQRVRYEQRQRNEQAVLRRQINVPLEQFVTPPAQFAGESVEAAAAGEPNLFDGAAAESPEQAEAAPGNVPLGVLGRLFSRALSKTLPDAPEKPAGAPFGGALPGMPAAPREAGNPFGQPAPAAPKVEGAPIGGDPFGGPPQKAPENPFGAPPRQDQGNPFGDDDTSPEKPAENAGGGNPFGPPAETDDQPEDKPAANPFAPDPEQPAETDNPFGDEEDSSEGQENPFEQSNPFGP